MTSLKKFNIFVFLSTFSKLMIEVFIPILLFDNGFGVKGVLIFFLVKFITIFFITIPTSYLGKKIKFKNLMIISNILFCISCIMINYIKPNYIYLTLLAVINGTYLIFYWISRHVYALNIITNKKTTESVSSFTIFALIAGIPATYIGALIIKHFGFLSLCIIVLIISLISVVPLFKIKEKSEKEKLSIKPIIKKFPKKNYIFILFYQINLVCISLFPLYIYLFVKSDLEYLGVVNIVCSISSIIYIYFLAKLMDKKKKDFLSLSCALLALIWIFKLNFTYEIIFLIIIFFEGIFSSGLETIVSRNIYSYGNTQKYLSYISFIEILNTTCRSLFIIFILFFKLNLITVLYIGLLSLIVLSIVKFDDGRLGY